MPFDLSYFNIALVHAHANSAQNIVTVVRVLFKSQAKNLQKHKIRRRLINWSQKKENLKETGKPEWEEEKTERKREKPEWENEKLERKTGM